VSTNYNYASIIPLIGGETIAMEKVFGKRPEYILSYSGFGANDSQLLNYYNHEVPYHVLDEGASHGGQVDIVNSVCPCAGLSTLSPTASSDNHNNDWMIESSRYVLREVKPKVLWGENSPHLAGKMGIPVVAKLRKIAEEFGYTFSLYRTKSMLHGIGQVRQRSFYFFWKDECVPLFRYYNEPMEHASDIILNAKVSEDDPMNAVISNKVPTDDPMYQHILEVIFEGKLSHKEFVAQLEKTASTNDIVEDTYGFENSYKVLAEWADTKEGEKYERFAASCRRKYDKLTKVGGGIMRRGLVFPKQRIGAFVGHLPTSLCHPIEDRFITFREALALMKMPDDFQLQGGKKNANMICQNVPVCTAAHMAENIKDYLEGRLDTLPVPFIKQDNTKQSYEVEHPSTSLEEFLV
jgi:site-specific DNA-cytosine methylase